VAVPSRSEYQQRIRFALAGLNASNGHFVFEQLCRELTKATIARNVLPATGPVSAGGDQGRDFESFPTALTDTVGDVGIEVGLAPGDGVAFVCTLQRREVRAKLLADISKVVASGAAVAWVVAFCAADVPVAARHAIEGEASRQFGVRVSIFDGNSIAELLADRIDSLGDVVSRYLHVSAAPDRHVPRGLPRGPLRFVNREREMAALDRIATATSTAAGPSVAVVAGMHGVGKSAMGAWWAHRNRTHFNGGDLFADFSRRRRGASVDVSELLADFLRELGTPDVAIPSGFDDRRRLYERLTTSRRLLVLLDDVDQAAQVLPMIPSGAGSMVIVTTSANLEELFWEGAELVGVAPLDEDASRRLLVDMAGSHRVDADPTAADALLRLCGGLPVVLCVCGGRLAAHPERSVAHLVAHIARAARPLQALSGTGPFAVEAVFDYAYNDLAPSTALVYRRLGLLAMQDWTAPVVAAAAGVPLAEVTEALGALRDAHLIEVGDLDRFSQHGLLRHHAALCVERDDGTDDRDNATRRIVDWYCAAVRTADQAVVADRVRLTDHVVVSAQDVPAFASPRDAFGWFASERVNVLAALRIAFDREWHDRVFQFAEALWPLCASHKYFAEWVESQQTAIDATIQSGDRPGEARVRSQLARAYAELGDVAQTEEQMRAAVAAVDGCGDARLHASVIEFGGVCDLRLARPELALVAFRQAHAEFEAFGHTRGMALQQYYSGCALVELGRNDEAITVLDSAYDGLRRSGDEISMGRVLVRRGKALKALRRHGEAQTALRDAVAIMERLDIAFEQADALEELAALADVVAERDQGRLHLQRAYRIYKELGHPRADELFARLQAS